MPRMLRVVGVVLYAVLLAACGGSEGEAAEDLCNPSLVDTFARRIERIDEFAEVSYSSRAMAPSVVQAAVRDVEDSLKTIAATAREADRLDIARLASDPELHSPPDPVRLSQLEYREWALELNELAIKLVDHCLSQS